MRFAYADPPYLGCAAKLYGDPTYDSIAAHGRLCDLLYRDFPDGWALSCSSSTLPIILRLVVPSERMRIAAWVKPFASFKPNVNPAYAWEPVIFVGGRKRSRDALTVRDWHMENIALERGLPGAKPSKFGAWIADLLGADFDAGDEIVDLFPGTHGASDGWRFYQYALEPAPTGGR